MDLKSLKAIETALLIRLIRGLSAVFWGIPLALLVCVRSAASVWLKPLDVLHTTASVALVCYGVWQFGYLHGVHSPSWTRTIDRCKMLAVTCTGLTPFIFFWNHHPGEIFFSYAIFVLTFSSFLFLLKYNLMLKCLGGQFTDDILKSEIDLFSMMNCWCVAILMLGVTFIAGANLALSDEQFVGLLTPFLPVGQTAVIILILMPVAMTMTLTWKVKECFLEARMSLTESPIPPELPTASVPSDPAPVLGEQQPEPDSNS